MASSRVGAIATKRGWCTGCSKTVSTPLADIERYGIAKASVLPLPVLAIPHKSLLCMMIGQQQAWMGVGFSNLPLQCFTSFFAKPFMAKPANGVISTSLPSGTWTFTLCVSKKALASSTSNFSCTLATLAFFGSTFLVASSASSACATSSFRLAFFGFLTSVSSLAGRAMAQAGRRLLTAGAIRRKSEQPTDCPGLKLELSS
mmetsp:Transcript_95481/g.179642  ORF Transcript_95481/g.179642 Transcript_95481/m.179642 type:complete len:202 (+) Transcript_95481:1273-1878(+)